MSPRSLIPSGKALEILVNCRQYCLGRVQAIRRMIMPGAEYADYYQNKVDEFGRRIRTVAGRPLELADVDMVRNVIPASSDIEKQVSVAALLAVLALHAGRHLRSGEAKIAAGDELGGGIFRVFRRTQSIFLQRWPPGKTRPRAEFEEGKTIEAFYPTICIEPVKAGEFPVRRVTLPSTIEDLFRRLDKGPLRLAVSHLSAEAAVRGHCPTAACRFILTSTGDDAAQLGFLDGVLRRCVDEQVSVLVLPELRVTPALLSEIRSFLKAQKPEDLLNGRGLLAVAAGSWHIADGGHFVNRSEILTAHGETLWVHDKLAEYLITADNIRRRPELKTLLGLDDNGGTEGILPGMEIQYCDTPIGRIAVAICAGFFERSLRELLVATRANIFLVPAMSHDTEPLVDCARDLVRTQWAATLAANCGAIAIDGGFIHTPRARHPTFMKAGWAIVDA